MLDLNNPLKLERMIRSSGGVPVELGADSTFGHRDTSDDVVFQEAGVYGTEDLVRVPTGRLPGLKVGVTITVDGETKTVVDHRRIDDGAMTAILLGE